MLHWEEKDEWVVFKLLFFLWENLKSVACFWIIVKAKHFGFQLVFLSEKCGVIMNWTEKNHNYNHIFFSLPEKIWKVWHAFEFSPATCIIGKRKKKKGFFGGRGGNCMSCQNGSHESWSLITHLAFMEDGGKKQMFNQALGCATTNVGYWAWGRNLWPTQHV